jgi:hypothetical protein
MRGKSKLLDITSRSFNLIIIKKKKKEKGKSFVLADALSIYIIYLCASRSIIRIEISPTYCILHPTIHIKSWYNTRPSFDMSYAWKCSTLIISIKIILMCGISVSTFYYSGDADRRIMSHHIFSYSIYRKIDAVKSSVNVIDDSIQQQQQQFIYSTADRATDSIVSLMMLLILFSFSSSIAGHWCW